MDIPKKIAPDPIVQAIIEIRFQPNVPREAVFGLLYSKVKDNYSNLDKLPILQLPEAVREMDPSLKYKPHYKLTNDNLQLLIGSDVIALVNDVGWTGNYIGWGEFSEKLSGLLDIIKNLELFDKIERIGIRYLNYFDSNIFEKINLGVSFKNENGKEIPSISTAISREIESGDFINRVQISNKATITSKGEERTGSMIDIDTFSEKEIKVNFNNFKKLIEDGHNKEKEIFFQLLKKDFIKTLNPEY